MCCVSVSPAMKAPVSIDAWSAAHLLRKRRSTPIADPLEYTVKPPTPRAKAPGNIGTRHHYRCRFDWLSAKDPHATPAVLRNSLQISCHVELTILYSLGQGLPQFCHALQDALDSAACCCLASEPAELRQALIY